LGRKGGDPESQDITAKKAKKKEKDAGRTVQKRKAFWKETRN